MLGPVAHEHMPVKGLNLRVGTLSYTSQGQTSKRLLLLGLPGKARPFLVIQTVMSQCTGMDGRMMHRLGYVGGAYVMGPTQGLIVRAPWYSSEMLTTFLSLS